VSRFIPQGDMSADELIKSCIQARAIIAICERSALNDLENGDGTSNVQAAEDIQFALQLARDLLEPVQDALVSHEGLQGGDAPVRMTGGQRNG
jgi:hypothetical protein